MPSSRRLMLTVIFGVILVSGITTVNCSPPTQNDVVIAAPKLLLPSNEEDPVWEYHAVAVTADASTVTAQLAKEGTAGWELVSSVPVAQSTTNQILLIFKRSASPPTGDEEPNGPGNGGGGIGGGA
ncbi:MAG TPA: hypothetical protein VGD69_22860 [Herpetosiphonaceae bacterium]